MNAATIAQALGNARHVGDEHICTCPLADEHAHGDADPSLHLKDADDGKVLVCCRSRHKDEQGRVVAALKLKRLLPSNNRTQPLSTKVASQPAKNDDDYEIVYPAPSDILAADMATKRFYKKLSQSQRKDASACRFGYRSENGDLLYYVYRFEGVVNDKGEERKEIRPLSYWRNKRTDKLEWRAKWPPSPRALYGLDAAASRPELPILLVEGEKKCHGANGLEGFGHATVAFSGGANGVEKSDFTPLAQNEVEVVIWPNNDKPGFDAAIKACRKIEGQQFHLFGAIKQRVYIVKPDPERPAGYDIGDLIEQGWSAQQLSDYIAKNAVIIDDFETYARERFPKKGKQLDAKKEKKSQADILIEIGKTATLFHDGDDSYADVVISDRRETYLIRSKGFRHWLLNSYLNQEGKAPCAEAIGSAINCLEAIGRCKGEEYKVFVRVGLAGDKLYLDLCNAKWQAVEIGAAGWRIVESKDCPVRFRRAKGMGPLPAPERGGSIEKLRDFLNLEPDNKSTDAESGRLFILIVGWLLSTFRDRGPYPVLVEHGEQGTAKTTTARFLRALIDPNVSPLRSEPKEPRDLMIAARNGWLIAYDNLSHLDSWLSDALCRLSTGGGFSTRALYTDQDEIIFEAQRPALLTGIEELATRGDLLDRSLIAYLPRIPDRKRKLEDELDRDFYEARPRILGALLDAVSGALRNYDSTKLDKLPRMADFAKWVSAAEPALGWKPGSFMKAYDANREEAVDLTLEASPVATAIKKIALPWEGTATELLKLLDAHADERTRKLKAWPHTGRGLSNALSPDYS